MHQDIGIGLIIAVLINIISPQDNYWLFVLFGALFSIAPDLDYIIYSQSVGWKTDRFSCLHRELFHYPLLFLVLGLIIWDCFGWAYGALWLLNSLSHFTHDSYTAWGICITIPQYERYVCLNPKSPKKYIKSRDEYLEIVDQHGNDQWFADEAIINIERVFFWLGFLIMSLYVINRNSNNTFFVVALFYAVIIAEELFKERQKKKKIVKS